MDTYVDDKFLLQLDPKDGYPVRDYRDVRHYRLLEFVVPIIHLDKPTWVTITIENTIFGALEGCRPINWGLVFKNLVHKLVGGSGKSKPTPIYPFSCIICIILSISLQWRRMQTTGLLRS